MISGNNFCYWDCKSRPDSYILMVLTFLALLLAIKGGLNLLKMWRESCVPKAILKLYIIVFVWSISFIVANVYSFIVFYVDFKANVQNPFTDDMTTYSRIYAFLQTIPAIAVQTLLFTIAWTMLNNSMGALLGQNQMPTGRQMRMYQAIRWYRWIRIVFLIFWVAILIPFSDPHPSQVISQVKIVALMIDCIFIILTLKFCHGYLLDKSDKLIPNNKFHRHRLLFESQLLILCGVCRLVIDSTFYLAFPLYFLLKSKTDDNPKPCLEQMSQHLQFSVLYLIFGTLLMHHLTIWVVLHIYKPGGDSRLSLLDVAGENKTQEILYST